MPRFFVDQTQIANQEITITGSDVNHIKNVLRMNIGEEISISDGKGKDYFGKIKEFSKDTVVVAVENSWDSYVELPCEIYLFQGLPKADKMELIIQKAVELGVYSVVPVVTKRTIVKLDQSKAEKKVSRWQNIAQSASKQAGRGIIPKVELPVSFGEALFMAKNLESSIIPYEKAEGMEQARAIIKSMKDKKSIGIFIGPEGGFDEKEIEEAKAAGVIPMTLGHRILRTETAGLAALSILMFEMDQ